MNLIAIFGACVGSIELDDGTNLLQTGVLQHGAQTTSTTDDCYVEHKGCYIRQQHGYERDNNGKSQCHKTEEGAKAECKADPNCYAIAYATVICGGGWRTSYGWTKENMFSYNGHFGMTALEDVCKPHCSGDKPTCPGYGCVAGSQPPASCWVEKPGQYVRQQHGAEVDDFGGNICFPTLEEAQAQCLLRDECFAISQFPNNPYCKGGYRISIGNPPEFVDNNSPGLHSMEYTCKERCSVPGLTCSDNGWECPRPPVTTTTSTVPPPPASCSGAQPRCAGVACIDGQWMCGGDYCPGTDSPGGESDVTDAKCFDADRGFGPDFSCANTEMYCSSDSGDGLTVGACCQTRCKKEFENKKKNSNAENKGKNEAERKGKRAGNEGSRKKNEKERKKKRKDTEWNTKRDASETQNKNAEDERKSKRGWKEGQRKNERGWKQNKRQRQAAADQRERARKETRNKNNKKPAKKPISKNNCAKNKKKYAKCKANVKCEKKFKKKGKKEPSC